MHTQCFATTRRFSAVIATLALSFTATNALAAAPKISGAPPSTVRVNYYYVFQPTASDPDTAKRKLRFSIVNKPEWAHFTVYSGRLEGKPTAAGSWSNIRITVTDGSSRATLPAFGITATTGSSGGGGGSQAPTISGTPPATATPGVAYTFTPTARDPQGDALTFSITNRPAWMSFSTTNGRLSGTPTSAHVGAYSNIRISVSDGRSTATLPAFAVTVSDTANGSASLSWTPPTRNTNGSALTNLAGYRVYYGTSAGALNRTVQIANPGVASYVVDNLAPATWYFAVRAYNTNGTESTMSNVASKTIR